MQPPLGGCLFSFQSSGIALNNGKKEHMASVQRPEKACGSSHFFFHNWIWKTGGWWGITEGRSFRAQLNLFHTKVLKLQVWMKLRPWGETLVQKGGWVCIESLFFVHDIPLPAHMTRAFAQHCGCLAYWMVKLWFWRNIFCFLSYRWGINIESHRQRRVQRIFCLTLILSKVNQKPVAWYHIRRKLKFRNHLSDGSPCPSEFCHHSWWLAVSTALVWSMWSCRPIFEVTPFLFWDV